MPTLAEIGIKLSKLDVVCMLGALSDSIVTLDEAANEIKTDIDKTNNAFTPEELELIKNSSIEDIEFKFSVDKTFLTLSNPKYPNGTFNVQNEDVVTFLKNAKKNKIEGTLETLFTNHIQSQAKKRANGTFSIVCDSIINSNFGSDLTTEAADLLKDELQKQPFNIVYSFLTNFKNEYKAKNEVGADSFGEQVVALKDEVMSPLIQDLEAVEIDERAADRVLQETLMAGTLPVYLRGTLWLQKKLDYACDGKETDSKEEQELRQKEYREVYGFCKKQEKHRVNFPDDVDFEGANQILESVQLFSAKLDRLQTKIKSLEAEGPEHSAASQMHQDLNKALASYKGSLDANEFETQCSQAIGTAEKKLGNESWFKPFKQSIKLVLGTIFTLGIANIYNHKTSQSGSYDFTRDDNDRVRKRVKEMRSTLKDLSFFKPENDKENEQDMLNRSPSAPGTLSQK